MIKLKNIFTVSLVAVMAVTVANAEIVSTELLNKRLGTTGNLGTAAQSAATAFATAAQGTAGENAKSAVDNAVTTAAAITTEGNGGKLVKASALGALAGKSAVTSTEITDGTIKNADIAADAAIATSKISGLATVATSGSYSDLSNKPTIPAAQVQTDWNATSGMAAIANKPTLATVATSGSYSDLSNKPTIDTAVSTTSTNAVQNKVITAAVNAKQSTANMKTSSTYNSNATDKDTTYPSVAAAEAIAANAAGVSAVARDQNATNKNKVMMVNNSGLVEPDLIVDANVDENAEIASSKIAFTTAQEAALNSGITSTMVDGVVDKTTNRVKIPVGSATGTSYAQIWVQ